jgi:hypothetical protein
MSPGDLPAYMGIPYPYPTFAGISLGEASK